MPVLGADPDSPENEWDESPRHTVRCVGQFDARLSYLINYFAYHKAMESMNRLCPPADKRILGYTFARLLKQGYTEQSLKFVVDRFFQSWARDTERPVMLFSKKDTLMHLLTEAEMVSKDTILQWLIEGMPNIGPVEEPKEYRKAVIMTCDECLRYPEVIADILRLGFGYPTLSKMLESLEAIVKYNLAGKPYDRRDIDPHLALLSTINLPKELRSHVPSPKGVRQKVDRLHAHVAGSVVARKKEKSWE